MSSIATFVTALVLIAWPILAIVLFVFTLKTNFGKSWAVITIFLITNFLIIIFAIVFRGKGIGDGFTTCSVANYDILGFPVRFVEPTTTISSTPCSGASVERGGNGVILTKFWFEWNILGFFADFLSFLPAATLLYLPFRKNHKPQINFL